MLGGKPNLGIAADRVALGLPNFSGAVSDGGVSSGIGFHRKDRPEATEKDGTAMSSEGEKRTERSGGGSGAGADKAEEILGGHKKAAR